MSRFGFCGPSYTSQSVNADCQRCLNRYPEFIESQEGRTAIALYPRPGLGGGSSGNGIAIPNEVSIPGLFPQNGRLFAVGAFITEIFRNNTTMQYGALNPSVGGVSIAANQNQLLICSNGNLYVLNLLTNAVITVNMAQFNGPIAYVEFCDSFFLAVQQNSQNFYTSNLLDGTLWQAVNAEQISFIPDFITGLKVSHRDIWIYGSKNSIVYQNSGAALAPFVPISGGFVEQGNIGFGSPVRLDNSLFWIGQDERGALIGWRANAYTPQRVSNHAIEYAWQQYSVVSDVISYACQFNGHPWWVVYFPTANATWVYDVATQMWHEWDYLDPKLGPMAHRSQCHAFAFNAHWVGDYNSGTVYQMSQSFNTDFGTPIRRLRRAPAISNELEYMFHHELTLDIEPGLGPMPPLAGLANPTQFILQSPNGSLYGLGVTDAGALTITPGVTGTPQTLLLNDNANNPTTSWQITVTNSGVIVPVSTTFSASNPNNLQMVSASGAKAWLLEITSAPALQTISAGTIARGPQVYLRWSDDGGHTWSSEYARDAGQAGKFRTRIVWRRLGKARNRVYEVTDSDNAPSRFVDAYLKASPGYQPQERLAHQYRKSS